MAQTWVGKQHTRSSHGAVDDHPPGPRRPLAAVLVVLLTVALPKLATAYHPGIDWHTLHTPHMRVHYPEGRYEQALDLARAAEIAYVQLTTRLAQVPDSTIEIVLTDDFDFAQGFAQNVPYNLVGLNLTPPGQTDGLGFYDDYSFMLVVHELTHIIHVDTMSGLPWVLNRILGKTFVPNALQPRWFVEGLATYFESALTRGGRTKSAYLDMIMRAAVLEGTAFELGEITGPQSAWPQGSVPYYYGAYFLNYIAERFGEKALRDISHDYGGRIVPWAVNLSVERATGSDYPELYDDFQAALLRRYQAERARIEQAGRVEGEPIADLGQSVGPARMDPHGNIYFSHTPVGEHAALKVLTTDGALRSIARVQGEAQVALVPGGRQAVVAQLEVHDTYRNYTDLFLVDLQSGASARLTDGARAREPDLSADGARIVFVQNDGDHSVVRIAAYPSFDNVRTLVDLGPNTQVYGPRFSPDGDRVAFVATVEGRRDIFIVPSDSVEGASGRRLTSDAAFDGGVAFAPDGAMVLYHSDADGVFNLFAVALEGGPPRRLTRVLYGAFDPEPTPDGHGLVYRNYDSDGFGLARIALPDLANLPPEEPRPITELARNKRDDPGPELRQVAELYPSSPYTAWPSILPRAWLPYTGLDIRGATLGLAFEGSDAVGLHNYSVDVVMGLESEFLAFAVGYANRQFFPGVTVRLRRFLSYAAMAYRRNRRLSAVEEEVWAGDIGTRWPIYASGDLAITIGTFYDMAIRENREPLYFGPEDTGPIFPDEGRFAALNLDLTISSARGYTDSISAEEGGRFVAGIRIEDPYLGSEYSAVSGTLRHSHYFENPWLDRHVLALTARFGYGKSSYGRRKLFFVNGLPRQDLVLNIFNNLFSSGAGALRGFSTRPFAGDLVINGSVEYRFPIFDVHQGYSTLPFHVRRLHAAAFFDCAAIGDEPEDLQDGLHASLGGELRLDLTLGYSISVSVRLGYGRGLWDDREIDNWFLVFGRVF